MVTIRVDNLYSDESKKYVGLIGKNMIVWTSDRTLAKNFKWYQLFYYKVFIKIKYGENVRRSSIISVEHKPEEKEVENNA